MRIGIASLGRVAEDTGGKNYILHFTQELQRINSEHECVLFLSEGEQEALKITPSERLSVVTLKGTRRTPLHKVIGEQLLLPLAARRASIDILYCPGNFVPIFSRITSVVNIRATAHFYGAIYGVSGIRRFIRKWFMPRSVRVAKAVITPSEDIKHDVVRFTHISPDKITVIPHGVDTTQFSQALRGTPEAREVLASFGLHEGEYLLYVSALWPYKNHARLLEAHAKLTTRHPALKLVIAGQGTGTSSKHVSRLKELPVQLGTEKLVTFTGGQPQSVLKYLYASASGFVFPSLYESFGNPIFESWASGVPIATSNVHAFPEIVGDAGILFDPMDVDSISHALLQLIEDDPLRQKLIESGANRVKNFTWDSCVRRTLSLLERVSQSYGHGL
jgi:glycosyltransferase involved in cell wall biosynthesis